MIEKMKFETEDGLSENVEKIAALFPSAVSEGKVNFEQLRTLLGDEVTGDEAYDFTWVGKREAMREAGRPIRKTLRPCPEESKDWDTTENLYIEGDNLDVLKLLQESYLGKVKMIYIDPPYNTGNDFVYRDDFSVDRDEYDQDSGVFDEEGDRLFLNTGSNGRFHSDWCSMMYPRLVLARNLLSDDGVIFISIDDCEQANLKKICDEVFGENQFIATFKWNRVAKAPSLSGSVRTKYEYVLSYYKNARPKLYGKDSYNTQGPLWHLPNKRAELLFPKRSIRVTKSFSKGQFGGTYDVELLDDLIERDGLNENPVRIKACSAWGQAKINDYTNAGKTFQIKKSPLTMYTDLDSEGNFIAPSDIINDEECGVKRNTDANSAMRAIGIPFDYSKPVSLIRYLVKMTTIESKSALILDFFSGSATTAHAVMQQNAEDGGKRKFIMVQLDEKTEEGSEAYQAGYENICEIGKERIRRAGEKIKAELMQENKQLKLGEESKSIPDIGFRVLKLDESNMKDVYYSAGEYDQTLLDQMNSNIKEDRTDLDLLYGCLLEWGLPLSLPHTQEEIKGVTVHTYNQGDLVACFAENVSESLVRQIASRQPLRVVFRDSSFTDSPARINVEEIFKLLAPNTSVRVI